MRPCGVGLVKAVQSAYFVKYDGGVNTLARTADRAFAALLAGLARHDALRRAKGQLAKDALPASRLFLFFFAMLDLGLEW